MSESTEDQRSGSVVSNQSRIRGIHPSALWTFHKWHFSRLVRFQDRISMPMRWKKSSLVSQNAPQTMLNLWKVFICWIGFFLLCLKVLTLFFTVALRCSISSGTSAIFSFLNLFPAGVDTERPAWPLSPVFWQLVLKSLILVKSQDIVWCLVGKWLNPGKPRPSIRVN